MNINNNFERIDIDGPLIHRPNAIRDKRGYFVKDFLQIDFRGIFPKININETFYSFSKKNVFRGFHFQLIRPQLKIVSCLSGKIIDFAVDLRPSSKYFKKTYQVELSSENLFSFIIPKGFAHGFLALKDSIVTYKCTEDYVKEYDTGFIYNDKTIGIDFKSFGVDQKDLIISDRDLSFKTLDEIISSLDF